MGSESKNSFIGSFLQPPDCMLPADFVYIESKKLAAAAGDRPSLPNSQAVVAALKALQEKIHHLEQEKSQAEDKLCSLSRAAAQYKKVLEHKSYQKDTAHQELMQQRKDASVQLNAVQSRCSLLEKQLDYMRKMVSSAGLEKKMILEQQAQLQKEEDQKRLELHAKLEKLEMLEKECLKLTATQRIAESCCLSVYLAKLVYKGVLAHHLKVVCSERITKIKRIYFATHLIDQSKFYSCGFKNLSKQDSIPLMLAELLRNLLHAYGIKFTWATAEISGHSALSKSVSSCSTSPTATRSFSDLLLALQDELGQMSFEHQELLKEIQGTQDSQACEDLEEELNCLIKQMEMKGKQISKLKKHQATVQKLKRKTQKLKQGETHVKLKCGEQKEAKELAVSVKESMSKPCPGQKSRSSL
ncbi:CE57L protein, partial [Horornis vulcanius]|nr:CE57L protein [Horornis vulcanius]